MSNSASDEQSTGQGYSQRGSDILVIIPAYNEEESIGQVVSAIKNNGVSADIVVINDGSTDSTAAVARRCGADVLDLPHNLGIGGAVGAGFKLARDMGYPFVVRMDADGQHKADDIGRLLSPVKEGKTDVAFGSRFAGNLNSYRPPLARLLGIRVFGFVVSLLIGQKICDATSGLWCANRTAVRFLARVFPQDYPEVESHVLLHRAGLSQMEIPVAMRPRMGGRSSIGFLQSIYYAPKVMLAALLRAVQKAPFVPEE